MAQAWTVLAGGDLWQVVSRSVVEQVNEDSAGGKNSTNDLNESLDTRASKAVAHAVAEVRGAIENAGRYPVSVTASSVPPEAARHTLALAAYVLVGPKPSLVSVVMMDGGMNSPIATLYAEAKRWLEGVNKGGSVTTPTDPCGEDYSTAVSDSNPLPNSISWGDYQYTGDEYAAGQAVDPVTGAITTLPVDMTT